MNTSNFDFSKIEKAALDAAKKETLKFLYKKIEPFQPEIEANNGEVNITFGKSLEDINLNFINIPKDLVKKITASLK